MKYFLVDTKDICTYELTAVMMACTTPVQSYYQISAWRQEHTILPQSTEILVTPWFSEN